MRRAFLYVFAVLFLSALLTGYQSGDGVLELFFNSRDGQVPVYRFFNTARGGHLYTISETERDYIMENLPQWTYEGIKFDVHDTLAPDTCAAYRFFNTRTGIHFYTINEVERDAVMQLDHYNYEGIKYYVFADFAQNTTAVYRFFNHVRGGHLYTVSEAERDTVMQLPNWTYEGISFYVYPHQESPAPVPKTGQITSYRDGDDGDYQMGVAWPAPRFTDHGDGTVTDNLTGLMWTKSANIDGQKAWDDAIDWCNALDHGGHSDWRLPNRRELLSLIDRGEYSPGLPDGHPFTDVQNSFYWSSSTYSNNTALAWPVNIGYGNSWYDDKTDTHYTCAVRGLTDGSAPVPLTGQITSYRAGDDGDYQMGVAWPDPRFTDHGDGTVTDNLTGLMWAKDANIDGTKTWDDAIDWCNALTHGSHDDWRLPNFLELHSLIDIANYGNALPDDHPFTGVQSVAYWSSTTCAYGTGYAWYVGLYYGHVYRYNKTGTHYAWPVRSGQ